MTWYFAYPVNRRPSGGHKQLRLMAQRLIGLGIDVALIREDADWDDSHYYGVPIPETPFALKDAGVELSSDDVLILPEYNLPGYLPTVTRWKCRLAVNNQNGYVALHHRVPDLQRRFGIEFVIANSDTVVEISRIFWGMEPRRIFNIPYWIIRPPFVPDAPLALTGDLAVAYMPRKCAPKTVAIRDAVRRREPNVPWVEIDGVPEAEVADKLRGCRIFLSTQYNEGFGLPSIEAMTCGCLVAGFAGTRGFRHPYANPFNGFWSRDGDVGGAVRQVCRAIEVARTGGEELASRWVAVQETLQRFVPAAVDEALADMANCVAHQAYENRSFEVPPMRLKERLTAWYWVLRGAQPPWNLRPAGRITLRDMAVGTSQEVPTA